MTRRALWLALALAACHDAKSHKAHVEANVRELIATGFAVHVPVTAVDCPVDVSDAPGARFDCQVTFEGGLVETAHIEIKSQDKADLHLDDDISLSADVAANVSQLLKKSESRDYDIDCGPTVVAVDHARCAVTDHGKPGGTVRVVRADGKILAVAADSAAVERRLGHWMEQVGPVDTVSCSPAGEIRPGVLTCDVRLESGARTTARYTVTAEDPKSVLTGVYSPPLVPLEGLASSIVLQKSGTMGAGLTVDCGKGTIIAPADGIVCSYVAGGEQGRLRATYTDGGVKLEKVL